MIIPQSLRILNTSRHPAGLFSVEGQLPFVQQNLFTALGLESTDPILAIRTYQALLDTLQGSPQEWNLFSKGLFALCLRRLDKNGYVVFRNDEDRAIAQQLLQEIRAGEFWKQAEGGMWNKVKMIQPSTIGACMAALELGLQSQAGKALQKAVQRAIKHGTVDLSLLALIWPLDVADAALRRQILQAVETTLYRERGLIRFVGDGYCYKDGEAEWPVGFAWLILAYRRMEMPVKYVFYTEKVLRTLNDQQELPELFFANTHYYNASCPSVWGQSLLMAALQP